MAKGCITYSYGDRFVDRITELMIKMKLFKFEDTYRPIYDKSDKEVAGFFFIEGRVPIVRLAEMITDYRGKNCVEVTVTR